MAGRRLVREHRPSVIMATYPIATPHVIGATLARMTGLPLVADSRDAMLVDDYPEDAASRWGYARIERRVVHRAIAAVFKAAHRRECELVLQIPLEPVNYPQVNPGPGTLLVTMKPARITNEVKRWLEQAGPVSAVANHMGSLATQDMTVMTALYRVLHAHLPFLHVSPAAGAVCRPLASEMGVVYEEPDLVLDAEPRSDDPRLLERRWKTVRSELRRRGHLVVWIRATPLTHRWLPRALEPKRLDDVDLVPLTALMRRPSPGLIGPRPGARRLLKDGRNS